MRDIRSRIVQGYVLAVLLIPIGALGTSDSKVVELNGVAGDSIESLDPSIYQVSMGPMGEERVTLRVVLRRVEIFNYPWIDVLKWNTRGFPKVIAQYSFDRDLFEEHLKLGSGFIDGVEWFGPRTFELKTSKGGLLFRWRGGSQFEVTLPNRSSEPHN